MDPLMTRLLAGLDLDRDGAPMDSAGRPAGEAIRGRLELLKLQFEYAWRDWQFNAQQRMSVFNYFVLATGAGASLLGVLVKDGYLLGAAAVGALAAALAGVFLLLDRRNEELLRASEDLLRALEEQALFGEETFAPPPRPRRWPLGLAAETLPEGTALPLGLRLRTGRERALRAAALAGDRSPRPGAWLLRAVRQGAGIGLDGQSPYRFGYWLPAIQIAVGAAFLAAAIACLAIGLGAAPPPGGTPPQAGGPAPQPAAAASRP
jgi:hypothetical protein